MLPSKPATRFAFLMITSLFFMWGFVHNLDPILIPHLKKSFNLNVLQSSLVDSSVFIAYFLMAMPAGYLMKKYSYKFGIIVGLGLFALGSFLFIPAANTGAYSFFLAALFIIACGLTLLETAANPYAALLGDPKASTQRLNFAQSFNGLAATIAPIIGARVILTKNHTEMELAGMDDISRTIALASEAESVKLPYFIIGTTILLIAIIFFFLKLPKIQVEEDAANPQSIKDSLKHPLLIGAVIAQFFYVGAQVCVFSFFILFAIQASGLDKIAAADYLGWGGGMAFMVGRFVGTFFMRFVQPAKLLMIYALICTILCLMAISGEGWVPIYALIGITFFMSIMFPTIFSLGIGNLGGYTAMGSSLIIMSIVGGALLPPIFGYISDITGNIQLAYLVPLICFLVVAWFGWFVIKHKRNQHA